MAIPYKAKEIIVKKVCDDYNVILSCESERIAAKEKFKEWLADTKREVKSKDPNLKFKTSKMEDFAIEPSYVCDMRRVYPKGYAIFTKTVSVVDWKALAKLLLKKPSFCIGAVGVIIFFALLFHALGELVDAAEANQVRSTKAAAYDTMVSGESK